MEEDFYTVDEAARILKLTPGRIRQMLRAGELEGVTDEHVATLRKASTTAGTASRYPSSGDPLAQAAYTAAALRGLVEALRASQGTAQLTTSRKK